jgi:hypothetical protein
MLQKAIKAGLLVLLLLFIASALPLGWPAIKILPFGWVNFLHRTLPDVSINWSGIGMVVLCSGLIIVALQWFLGWVHRACRAEEFPWRWRWTVTIYASFWILFGIVIGASGAMRQTTWLLQFTEPVYKARRHEFTELRMVTSAVELALLETGRDLHKSQSLLASYRSGGFGSWDHHQFVFLADSSNRIETVLIVPRDPDAQRQVGFTVVGDNNVGEHVPIERLGEFLGRN